MSPPPRDGSGPRDIIHIVDDNLRTGFAQVPRPVLRARGLSVKAKLVYVLLLDYAWKDDRCFPGQDTLAVDLDVSTDTVQRALKELRTYQLVDWKQLGLNRPNVYYILRLSECPHLDLGGNRKLRLPETAPLRHPEAANCGTTNTQETILTPSNTTDQSKANFAGDQTSKFRIGTHQKNQAKEPGLTATSQQVPTPLEKAPAAPKAARGPAAIGEVLRSKGLLPQRTTAAASPPVATVQQPDTSTDRTPAEVAEVVAGAAPQQPRADHRRNGRATVDERQSIQAYLGDFAPELGDQAPFQSSVTRVSNIYADSGLTMAAFVQRLYAARSRTKERYSAIRDHSKRFAYFCSLLEEECGLRQPPPEVAAAAQARAADETTEPRPARRKSLAGKYQHLVKH